MQIKATVASSANFEIHLKLNKLIIAGCITVFINSCLFLNPEKNRLKAMIKFNTGRL